MNRYASIGLLRFIRPLTAVCRREFTRYAFITFPSPYLVRHYATPPPMLTTSNMAISDYHDISDATMDSLLESLEILLDSTNNKGYEVEYSNGVLTLSLGDKGTYVINKQPPNKQIWLSSPVSGPKRYNYSEEQQAWFYSRDGKTIGKLLKEELELAVGSPVNLAIK